MIRLGFLLAAVALVTTPAAAVTRTDSAGDFLPTYVGPHNGDLDVLKFSTSIVGSNFVLSATLNGPVGTTPGVIYVWGVNRGAGNRTVWFQPWARQGAV